MSGAKSVTASVTLFTSLGKDGWDTLSSTNPHKNVHQGEVWWKTVYLEPTDPENDLLKILAHCMKMLTCTVLLHIKYNFFHNMTSQYNQIQQWYLRALLY
jgi:hypothetical protein